MRKNILITGGAGFIGSHVVRHFVKKYPEYFIINLDKLTYAGNLENLKDIENHENYSFVKGDICDSRLLEEIFTIKKIDGIIHLAAESHVDRSILNPMEFVETNVKGTVTLLNTFKQFCDIKNAIFYHVSTDEVYGELDNFGKFSETTPYSPNSPYSASKAASDHFVRAYHSTYGLNIKISNCSNNYGPFHFPEKLIPLMINNILNKKELPVYGKGENIRDWLFVKDHAVAIDIVFHKGKNGETYNIGGNNEWKNIELVKLLCKLMDEKLGNEPESSLKLIKYVKDRAGHDFRYAIDSSKIMNELGWQPSVTFEQGLAQTIDWYLTNKDWLQHVTSGDYKNYYSRMYEK
ncbi:MAG: dTDP-glucose 4,6-dehydratase [Bacteroidetes bacterium]|nr:dTDP-glucose 4,6-dehydratase [Bacteroidota bacterium]